jgi:cell division protein FtsZ
VTKPFQYEGQRRNKHAEEGIRDMRRHVDTLLIIPNQRLLGIVDKSTPLLEAFKVADDVLRQAIQGIADVITTTGHVNVDFADVRTVMSHTGRAVMGMGVSRGPNRAIEAAQKAMCSPLLEEGSVEGARGVLLNITGGASLSLHEVEEAASIIQQTADSEANIIVGQVINPDMGEDLIITVIATGFEREEDQPAAPMAGDRGVNRPAKPIQPLLAGMVASLAADRPMKDLDRPTFLRRMTEMRDPMDRTAMTAEDEWDVPTFLRKQAD